MSKSKSVELGRFSFPSIKVAIAAISTILNAYEKFQRVTDPEDEALLLEVLKNHPDASVKTKGLAILYFEVHPNTGGNRCFHFYREDGSRDHFGFQKCVLHAASKL